jgi:hypothetical protein
MEKDKRITDGDWAKYHTSEVIFRPKNMTIDELQQGYWWTFRKTYTLRNIIKRCMRSPKNIMFRIAMNYSYRKKALRMPDIQRRS